MLLPFQSLVQCKGFCTEISFEDLALGSNDSFQFFNTPYMQLLKGLITRSNSSSLTISIDRSQLSEDRKDGRLPLQS